MIFPSIICLKVKKIPFFKFRFFLKNHWDWGSNAIIESLIDYNKKKPKIKKCLCYCWKWRNSACLEQELDKRYKIKSILNGICKQLNHSM